MRNKLLIVLAALAALALYGAGFWTAHWLLRIQIQCYHVTLQGGGQSL